MVSQSWLPNGFKLTCLYPGVVRKQIGLSFEGSSTPERWVMGELELGGLDSDVRRARSIVRIHTHPSVALARMGEAFRGPGPASHQVMSIHLAAPSHQ